jgi:hypothetical protein
MYCVKASLLYFIYFIYFNFFLRISITLMSRYLAVILLFFYFLFFAVFANVAGDTVREVDSLIQELSSLGFF